MVFFEIGGIIWVIFLILVFSLPDGGGTRRGIRPTTRRPGPTTWKPISGRL